MDLRALSAEDLAERAQQLLAELAAVHAALAARLRQTSEDRQAREEARREAELLGPSEWAEEAGLARATAYRIAARQGWGRPVRQARSEWRRATRGADGDANKERA